MKKENDPNLRRKLISLLEESKRNFSYYISDGRLNSEGKKIQLQMIKVFVQYTNDKHVLVFLKKNDEFNFIKMLNYLQKAIENSTYL
ncbi:MAG TPA: hypothetical protein VKU94_02715 [Geobacterales bacterium]|nr:hypothetical protein [Geobacterales bacterium]